MPVVVAMPGTYRTATVQTLRQSLTTHMTAGVKVAAQPSRQSLAMLMTTGVQVAAVGQRRLSFSIQGSTLTARGALRASLMHKAVPLMIAKPRLAQLPSTSAVVF